MPEPHPSFFHYFLDTLASDKEKAAFVLRRRLKKESVKYGEIPDLLAKIEKFFTTQKIAAKNSKKTIVVWGENCPEFALLLLASWCFDISVVSFSFATSREEVAQAIKNFQPQAIFVARSLQSSLPKHSSSVFVLEELFVFLQELTPFSLPELRKKYSVASPEAVQRITLVNASRLQLDNFVNTTTVSLLPLSVAAEQILGLLVPLQLGVSIFYLPRLNAYRVQEGIEEFQPRYVLVEKDKHVSIQKVGKNIAQFLPDWKKDVSITSLVEILARITNLPHKQIQKTDTLYNDLQMDSLSRLELVTLIEEHLGVMIDEAQITQKTTVADLYILVKTAQGPQQPHLPLWQFTWWGMLLRKFILRFLMNPLYSLIIKIEYPQKQLPKIRPGSIIIFNHPGVLDGGCVVKTLIHKQHTWKFFSNSLAELWESGKWMSKFNELAAGAVPLYSSGHKLQKVLQLDADFLEKGYNLLFAPTGVQQRQEKEDPFQPGIGYLLKELNVPVTILKIIGYREIWPAPQTFMVDTSFWDLAPRKRGTVKVVISQAYFQDWKSMTPKQIATFLEKEYLKLGAEYTEL